MNTTEEATRDAYGHAIRVYYGPMETEGALEGFQALLDYNAGLSITGIAQVVVKVETIQAHNLRSTKSYYRVSSLEIKFLPGTAFDETHSTASFTQDLRQRLEQNHPLHESKCDKVWLFASDNYYYNFVTLSVKLITAAICLWPNNDTTNNW